MATELATGHINETKNSKIDCLDFRHPWKVWMQKVRLHPVKAEIDHLHIDAAKEEAFVNYYNLTYRFWDFL